MHYEGNLIRPPSEANSIILQVTVGCTHNKCSFCGTYKDAPFRIKEADIVAADINFAATYCQRQKRVFLADGDVLNLSQRRLLALFTEIRNQLPWVNKISLYANAKAIRNKSDGQLAELKELGLARVYMGLESGHNKTLKAINKGGNAEQMIAAGQKMRQAGIFLSVTVLLGIAGAADSQVHARETGQVLTSMQPSQIGALTLMLLPGTELYKRQEQGSFIMPDQQGLLKELYTMVDNINPAKVQFQANHASNYLPINCRLPRDKEKVLGLIDQAIKGKIDLKPEYMRGL